MQRTITNLYRKQMHLYNSQRKWKNGVVKMTFYYLTEPFSFVDVHCIVQDRKLSYMHRQSSSQHHLHMSSVSKHMLCIPGASRLLLAHISLALFVVLTKKRYLNTVPFPLTLTDTDANTYICMRAHTKHSSLPYSLVSK